MYVWWVSQVRWLRPSLSACRLLIPADSCHLTLADTDRCWTCSGTRGSSPYRISETRTEKLTLRHALCYPALPPPPWGRFFEPCYLDRILARCGDHQRTYSRARAHPFLLSSRLARSIGLNLR